MGLYSIGMLMTIGAFIKELKKRQSFGDILFLAILVILWPIFWGSYLADLLNNET